MGWIGVDLDGTIADYGDFKGPGHIGKPIPKMVARIKKWLAEGEEVRILTARVCSTQVLEDAEKARVAIKAWCLEHIGQELRVTSEKDYKMWVQWDDRVVQVKKNTGVRVGTTLVNDAERLAQKFHETYERRAPEFNYNTRIASAVPWSEVPENNKKLMIAVCKEILDDIPV